MDKILNLRPTRLVDFIGNEHIKGTLDIKIKAAKERHAPLGHMIFKGHFGCGKCLSIDTEILMFDGSIKKVQNIVVGDKLMGPDSTCRNVLSICRGKDKMYKIVPKKGDFYTVNEPHILSFKKSGTEDIINISVKEYLSKSLFEKYSLKGYKVAIDFNSRECHIDPYFIGLWLGDETSSNQNITLSNKCLQNLNLIDNKHIPDIFKINDRKVRLELLAGLIDSDGYLYGNNCYEICTKFEKLKDDILYLCRSLGLAANSSIKYNKKYNKDYYRIIISGNTEEIPVKILYKKASKRLQKKDVLKVGIKSVEDQGIGEYFGFEIDGDGLFLLKDFTVTHNTTLSQCVANEMNGEFHFVNSAALTKKAHISRLFAAIQKPNSVIMVDEIHRMDIVLQEYLYPVMEDFELVLAKETRDDSGTFNKARPPFTPIKIKPFTLIGATTDIGLLSGPFLSRFQSHYHLDRYSVEDISKILSVNAKKLSIAISDDGILAIAERSKNIPRIANSRLCWIDDWRLVKRITHVKREHVEDAMRQAGINDIGLEHDDLLYLACLSHIKPTGLTTISSTTGLTESTIRSNIEPFLISQKLIRIEIKGRVLENESVSELYSKRTDDRLNIANFDVNYMNSLEI